MYSIIGYDKDRDVYHVITQFESEKEAVSHAVYLLPLLKADKLRYSNEPIDYLEVYRNWCDKGEELIWASYPR